MALLFESDGLRLHYSPLIRSLSLSKSGEWMSISINVFEIWMLMIAQEEKFMDISIKQTKASVEITNIMENYVIWINIISRILVPMLDAERILFLSKEIKRKIDLMNNDPNLNRTPPTNRKSIIKRNNLNVCEGVDEVD